MQTPEQMTGEEMREIRKALGLNQAELGEKLGMGGNYIGQMERDAKPIEKRTALAVRYLAGEAAGT